MGAVGLSYAKWFPDLRESVSAPILHNPKKHTRLWFVKRSGLQDLQCPAKHRCLLCVIPAVPPLEWISLDAVLLLVALLQII